MEHLFPFVSEVPSQSPPAAPSEYAAQAQKGSATALAALSRCCQHGPVPRRIAALRLLPGLLPFQPAWPILDLADRPSSPASVRRTIAQVRPLIDEPREHEPIYRALQQALCRGFVGAERERARPSRRTARRPFPGMSAAQYLRLCEAVVRGLYDYRFEWADGCIGDLQVRHVEEYLLEYAPRRLLLEPPLREHVPAVLMRHFTWLGHGDRLLLPTVQRLCRCTAALSRRFQRAMSQTGHPGSPRVLLLRARGLSIDLSDPQAVHRHLTLQGLDLHDEFSPVFADPDL